MHPRSYEIRNVEDTDLAAVLELNEAVVPAVNSVDLAQMQWFAEHAAYFRVAVAIGRIGAFLIGLRPGTAYGSPNYRWFCEHYDDFGYIDRVAVAVEARRKGLASVLYSDFAAALPAGVSLMTCEVNLRPPNESSMRFHEAHGFCRVGSQVIDDGAKEVALLAREL